MKFEKELASVVESRGSSALPGIQLPVDTDALLRLVNRLINSYGDMACPGHTRRDYVALETTRGFAELENEGEA